MGFSPARLSLQRLWHGLLRTCAAGLFLFYCVWQVYWLGNGRIPPALFLALTGWPAPTTGGTRALILLLQGDWSGSLHQNAMAVPMVLLLMLTLALLVQQIIRRRRPRLPEWVFLAWIAVLSVAWVIQLSRSALASDLAIPSSARIS
jgi:hypothetical protein